jgi:hypothetical protein
MRLPYSARWLAALVLAVAAVVVGANPARSSGQQGHKNDKQDHKLALLITVSYPGEYSEAAWNDLTIMYQAVRARGFAPEQILTLSGSLKREQVLAFLRDAHSRVAPWSDGVVFLYYSGSGYFPEKAPVAKIQTGWELGDAGLGQHVLWNEVFETLGVPKGVSLQLLADCCYTNTLADPTFGNVVPANVAGVILQAKPGQTKCPACNFKVKVNDKIVVHGYISFHAAQALQTAETIEDWARQTTVLGNNHIMLAPLGNPQQKLLVGPG